MACRHFIFSCHASPHPYTTHARKHTECASLQPIPVCSPWCNFSLHAFLVHSYTHSCTPLGHLLVHTVAHRTTLTLDNNSLQNWMRQAAPPRSSRTQRLPRQILWCGYRTGVPNAAKIVDCPSLVSCGHYFIYNSLLLHASPLVQTPLAISLRPCVPSSISVFHVIWWPGVCPNTWQPDLSPTQPSGWDTPIHHPHSTRFSPHGASIYCSHATAPPLPRVRTRFLQRLQPSTPGIANVWLRHGGEGLRCLLPEIQAGSLRHG